MFGEILLSLGEILIVLTKTYLQMISNNVTPAANTANNPAAFVAAQQVSIAPSACGTPKPQINKQQFNLVAIVTGALTVYLPSFDGIAELNSGHPTSLEGSSNAIGNNSIFFVQEIYNFGNSPSSTTDGQFNGEYVYTIVGTAVTGAVTLTSAAAFMRRVAMLPIRITGVQMTTAESTSIITTLNGYYGNVGGNTQFIRQLNPVGLVSGSNTIYANNEQWWLTGGTQLWAVVPAAGTYKWTFTSGGYGDNFYDVTSNQ